MGDGDGCAKLGVVFYQWGGLQALALITMGVALVAILVGDPSPTVQQKRGTALALVRRILRHRHLCHAVL